MRKRSCFSIKPGRSPEPKRFSITTPSEYADNAEHKYPGFTFWYFRPGEELNYYLHAQPIFFDKFDLPREI